MNYGQEELREREKYVCEYGTGGVSCYWWAKTYIYIKILPKGKLGLGLQGGKVSVLDV